MNIYPIAKPLLFSLKPETAHDLSIFSLKNNLIPGYKITEYDSLKNNIFGMDFKNPIGLAAGYDKNAEVFNQIKKFGFGFVECGTVTPLAQDGNPKPRLFRLKEDRAIINRMGFNNKGLKFFKKNIQNKIDSKQIVGTNIGKNKDTKEEYKDYLQCLEELFDISSYITINISSPNTKNLRNIQDEENLEKFLKKISKKKQDLCKKYAKETPIILKIAPDLNENEVKNIARIILKNKEINAVAISNTTINDRENLKNKSKNETGGLSGKPLLKRSNTILKTFYQETNGTIPIIGIGGISNAKEAYEKIKLGASLIQIYSSFIYEGFYLVEKIKKELDYLVKNDGFNNISQAIGLNSKK